MKNIEFKYLDISNNDKDFGLWINTVGFQSIDPNTNYPLLDHPQGYYFNPKKGRVLDEYQLVFISKGEGSFTATHYDKMPVKQGKLIFLFPGQWHTYFPVKEKGWDEYYIGFKGPTIDHIISKLPLVQENQILDIGLNEELESLFKQAIEAAKEEKQLTQQYLAGVAMHMIGLIVSANFNHNTESEIEQKIESSISLMSKNLSQEIDIIQIANDLNMSYSYFRKEFKRQTGKSPNQYIQDLKIKEAKRLLFSSTDSVKEISFKLGYNTPEYFTCLFKKRVGQTPLEYRSFSRCENK